jgi:hypothetical protein
MADDRPRFTGRIRADAPPPGPIVEPPQSSKDAILESLFAAPKAALQAAGPAYDWATEKIGNVAGGIAGQPFPALAPNFGVPNPEGLARDITAMLQAPTHGGIPHPNPETLLAAAPLAAAAKGVKRVPKELPKVTWNPETQAWEGGPVKGVPLDPPAHVNIPDIYDTQAPELADVPPVPQVELQRYEPIKGPSQRVADLIANQSVRDKMLASIKRGAPVGMSWHNAQPAIQGAIDALGSEEAGRAAFKRLMDYNAATSSLNSVPTNIREASYYYYREPEGPVEVGSSPPDPYHGGLANQGHQKAVNQILAGTWDTGDLAKTPSYGANLEGNLQPVAVDRHAIRAPAMLAEDPRFLQTQIDLPKGEGGGKYRPQDEFNAGRLSMEDALKKPTYWTDMPADNEYAALEDYYQGLSKEAGMAPGQGQASGWVGNAELTGVETDPRKTWLDMFQDRIKNTAYRMGKDPKDVERDFWQRKYPLLSVGAVPAGASMMSTPTGSSPEYDDWWKRLQDQQFAGGSSTPPG